MPTPRKASNRPAKRELVRWNEDLDKILMLSMQYVCSSEGIKIPWDNVAEVMRTIVAGNVSGGAIVQHLAKLRQRMVDQKIPVPPPLKRGGTTTPSKIYAKKRKPLIEATVDTETKPRKSRKKDFEDDEYDSDLDPDNPDGDWEASNTRPRRSSTIFKKIKQEEEDDEEVLKEEDSSKTPSASKDSRKLNSNVQKGDTNSYPSISPVMASRRKSAVDYAKLSGEASSSSDSEREDKQQIRPEARNSKEHGEVDAQMSWRVKTREDSGNSSSEDTPTKTVRISIRRVERIGSNNFEMGFQDPNHKSKSPSRTRVETAAGKLGKLNVETNLQDIGQLSPFGNLVPLSSSFTPGHGVISPGSQLNYGFTPYSHSAGIGSPMTHGPALYSNQSFPGGYPYLLNHSPTYPKQHPSARSSFSNASFGSTSAFTPTPRPSMDSMASQGGNMTVLDEFVEPYQMEGDSFEFGAEQLDDFKQYTNDQEEG